MQLSRFHSTILIATTLLTLTSLSVPAAAADVLSDSGKTGVSAIKDTSDGSKQGASCNYEQAGAGGIDSPTVHGPKMFGTSSHRRAIGWRFIIERGSPTGTFTFHTVFTSPTVKSTATKTSGHRFQDRTWKTPEHPTGFYRARIVMQWYAGDA